MYRRSLFLCLVACCLYTPWQGISQSTVLSNKSTIDTVPKPPPVVSTYPDWASDSALFISTKSFSFPKDLGNKATLDDKAALSMLRKQEVRSLYFASGSDDITAKQEDALVDVAALLTRYPSSFCLQLIGYTDPYGSTAFNLELAEKRAKRVEEALIDLGVVKTQIAVTVIGEADDQDSSREARRVELRLLLR